MPGEIVQIVPLRDRSRLWICTPKPDVEFSSWHDAWPSIRLQFATRDRAGGPCVLTAENQTPHG